MPTIISRDVQVGADAVTEKQAAFLRSLVDRKIFPRLGDDRNARIVKLNSLLPGMTKIFATRLIGDLVVASDDRTPRTPTTEDAALPLTAGVYEVNGEIFNVKWNQRKTNLYAQRLIEINGDRLTELGDVVRIEFEYAPGVVKRLKPHQKMSIERARELTIRYGRCLACGRALKNAESVERGIGPVCRKSFTS
jgi:hypothetical protein